MYSKRVKSIQYTFLSGEYAMKYGFLLTMLTSLCGMQYAWAVPMLAQALHNDDLPLAYRLIDACQGLNEPDENGITPLFWAARGGYRDVVKKLLELDVDVNYQSLCKETALIHAVDVGNAEMVKLLLDAGADVNMCDQWQQSPLARAAARGDLASVRLFLHAGAEHDICDIYGQNALSKALDFNHSEVARELIRAGAHVPQWYMNGVTSE